MFQMVKQKKRTRIMQSGKKLRHKLRRPRRALDLKTKDFISPDHTLFFSSLVNHNPEFRGVICTVLHFLHWCITHFSLVLHTPVSANHN